MRVFHRLVSVCLLLPALLIHGSISLAQMGYPERIDPYGNDYADVIPPNEEAGLRQRLQDLDADRGIEGTVLTIRSVDDYAAGDSIEAFAARVFNRWGIDDAETNDGFLIVLAVEDREVRIELGRAYGRRYDDEMQEVVDHAMLPWFREGNYSRGLLAGTDATIEALTTEGGFLDRIFAGKWIAVLIAVAGTAVAAWRRIAYYLSGGCLLELPGLVSAAVGGALVGGFIGAVIGMIGFEVNNVEVYFDQLIGLFESGRFVQEFSPFGGHTLRGASIGAVIGVMLRLVNPRSQRYRRHYGGGGNGGGSSGGGGASGSW